MKDPTAERQWLLAALLLVASLAGIDLVLGPDINFTGILTVGPFLGSAMVGRRRVAAIAATTLVLAVGVGAAEDVDSAEYMARSLAVTFGGALAVWVAGRRERRERMLSDLAKVASAAQLAILTPIPARASGVLFASRYLSASREALIGGDLFEVVETPHGARVIVGDVRGRGLDAIRLAAVVLGTFREAAETLESLVDVVLHMESRLRRHLGPEDFVTAVLGEFHPSGQLTLVNCGHYAPLVVRPDRAELLTPPEPTTPLGLGPTPLAQTTTLDRCDRVLFYTDGLAESRRIDGSFIDIAGLVGTLREPDLDGALSALLRRVSELVGTALDDDLALLLAEYDGETPCSSLAGLSLLAAEQERRDAQPDQ